MIGTFLPNLPHITFRLCAESLIKNAPHAIQPSPYALLRFFARLRLHRCSHLAALTLLLHLLAVRDIAVYVESHFISPGAGVLSCEEELLFISVQQYYFIGSSLRRKW